MGNTKFWKLIENAKKASGGDVEEEVELPREKLLKLSRADIQAFYAIFWSLMNSLYTWDLWAAAYIMNGGCSDDCFDYFRGWLIAQGEAIFHNAIRDPQTLVDLASGESEAYECEDILYVTGEAYEEKTGEQLTGRSYIGEEPAGGKWNEDELEEKYPKLWAAFAG